MTHITQSQQFESWWESAGQFSRAGGGDYEKTFAFNAWQASIQTYLDSLSAELPEPYVWGVPGYGDVGYYSRDQLTQALAARDAKWQGFEQDYLDKCKELDILQAERDAALAEAQKQAGLAAAWKLTHDAVLAKLKSMEDTK